MLTVLVLAPLVVFAAPAPAPPTDLPPAADPCVALTPAVVDQLRTSGALNRLVPDDVPTSTLITAGRARSGCPSENDPDPASIRASVCPLLTAEGVAVLADRFQATPAVRADLGPDRVVVARGALRCDSPPATASVATPAVAARPTTNEGAGDTVDRADRGVLGRNGATAVLLAIAVASLIGVLALLGRGRRPRQSVGEHGAYTREHVVPSPPAAPEQRPTAGPEQERTEGPQRTPDDGPDAGGRPAKHADSYDELLDGLRREVAELRRADAASRRDSARPDDPHGP